MCVNVHPSHLPQWRGSNPLGSAILSDQKTTGVTLQTVSEKFDEGDIILQSGHVLNLENRNIFTLGLEAGTLGGEMVLEMMKKYPNIDLKPQSGIPSHTVGRNKRIKVLDLSLSRDEILKRHKFRQQPLPIDFFNKRLIPIGLSSHDGTSNEMDQLEKRKFIKSKNGKMIFKAGDGKLISFTHFRWTPKKNIMSVQLLNPWSFK